MQRHIGVQRHSTTYEDVDDDDDDLFSPRVPLRDPRDPVRRKMFHPAGCLLRPRETEAVVVVGTAAAAVSPSAFMSSGRVVLQDEPLVVVAVVVVVVVRVMNAHCTR